MTDLSSLCQLLCRLTSRPPPTPGSASSSLGPTPSASSSGPAPSGSTPSTLQQQLQQPLKLRQPVVGSGVGDVSSFVYPVLATLASYPTHLDRKAQVCLLWRVLKFLSDTVLQKILDTVLHKINIKFFVGQCPAKNYYFVGCCPAENYYFVGCCPSQIIRELLENYYILYRN